MIRGRSGLFAQCRAICCDSVATKARMERTEKMASGSGLTRGTVTLTHRAIEALRPAETPYRVSDQRCIGLAVRVAPSGIKTWDLAYRIRGLGKVRRVSLGRLTVEKLIELYLRRQVAGRLRTEKEIESRLRRALNPILHCYAADIRRREI